MTIYDQEQTLNTAFKKAQLEWDQYPNQGTFNKYKEAWVSLQMYMQLQKLDAVRHWQEKRRNALLKR